MDNPALKKLPANVAKFYEPMLKTPQAAAMLGVSPHFLYKDRLLTEKRPHPLVPFVKMGKSVRYRLSDLQAFIAQSTQSSSDADTE